MSFTLELLSQPLRLMGTVVLTRSVYTVSQIEVSERKWGVQCGLFSVVDESNLCSRIV